MSATISPGAFRPFVAQKLMDKQAREQEDRSRAIEDAKLENMTLRKVMGEIGSTARGIMMDAFQNTNTHKGLEVFTADNRLRGMGMFMILLSLALLTTKALLA